MAFLLLLLYHLALASLFGVVVGGVGIQPVTKPGCVIGKTVDDHVIQVGVILPQDVNHPFSLKMISIGIEVAVESIHIRRDLLHGYTILLHYGDSQCSNKWGPLKAIDMVYKGEAHVFFGPACDYAVAPIARFSDYWNIPVITGGAMVSAFSNKAEYKLLTRISGDYVKLGEFFSDMFSPSVYNWTKPGYIYHKSPRGAKSDCYFQLAAVYESLLPRFVEFHPMEATWQRKFDEDGVGPHKPNFSHILNVGQDCLRFNARGKTPFLVSWLRL